MAKCKCDNCTWRGDESELANDLASTPDLGERLDPGSVVPAGECPKCRCFAYLVKERKKATKPKSVCVCLGMSHSRNCPLWVLPL